jgi:hypothetical protein
MIKGLGKNKQPFLYLDDYCPTVDWHKLHAEVSRGLANCQWIKRFVSAGVHPEYKDKEISTYTLEQRFSDYEREIFLQFDRRETEKRIKYAALTTEGLHPFWSCFLRLNRVIESTGISNKHCSEDCEWTENAKHFPELLSLIEQMPFSEVGRVMCFITEPFNETIPHFDDSLTAPARPNDDFIYFSTLKSEHKKIFVMDKDSMKKYYPETDKNFLWFNEMDYHGTDACSRLTFTIRIEGVFKSEVKEKLFN